MPLSATNVNVALVYAPLLPPPYPFKGVSVTWHHLLRHALPHPSCRTLTGLQGKTVYISNPTWGNHRNIFGDEGVEWKYYR